MKAPDNAVSGANARPGEIKDGVPTPALADSAGKPNAIMATLPFSVLLAAGAYLLSYVVTRGESFGDVRFLFLQARPRLFLIGLVLAIAYGVLLAVLLRRRTTLRWMILFNTIPLLLCAAGLLVASLIPGSARTSELEYVPSARQLSTTRYAVPVLFPTGRHEMTAAEQARLRESVKIFIPCGLSDLKTIGFASSTPYAQSIVEDKKICDSECRNLRLANLRGETVKEFIEREFKMTVVGPFWNTPAEMVAARRLADLKDGHIEVESERLNRRAELSWTTSGCR